MTANLALATVLISAHPTVLVMLHMAIYATAMIILNAPQDIVHQQMSARILALQHKVLLDLSLTGALV